MPYGKGTYGSKLGRPAGRRKSPGPAAPRPKKKKDVNVPGEKERAFKGRIDRMISKVESEFKKWKKSRRPHKNI
jgi:hypothetical protein